jgi:ATP-binding cassette subfamily F protein 3
VLTIAQLSKRYGGQVLFENVSWFVPPKARVGLVGANGSGKSTLLRMIARELEPDGGTISIPKECTVGYLSQEVFGLEGKSVVEQALSAFSEVRGLADQCAALEHQLATVPPDDPGYEGILDRYTELRGEWDARGCYDMETQAQRVLAGLGFRQEDFDRDCSEFSGGWQMRVALATLLLRQPDLLLLDEPTNHLDIDARNWLEEFLRDYPHTVILVAHDRYFLDVVVDRICEVSRAGLTEYRTNYSRYLVEREERIEAQAEAYRRQQEEIERLEAFISRFRYQASKAALVQSRIKQLEKIERLHAPEGFRSIHFRFPQPPRSGRIVLRLDAASKSYGALRVYDRLDLAIERGRKIALVGPNGAGKSTLVRMLAGTLPLDSGERVVGHNVDIGYFAQDQTQVLDPAKTVLGEMTGVTPSDLMPRVRSILGAFLFSGDAVEKRTGVLSGGERNRLALAKLLVHPANCLLLDEPTNHLDIHAKEVLLDALLSYEGTLILVAHDRYILDRVPTEVIEVGHATAHRYPGNYEDYLLAKARDAAPPAAPSPIGGTSPEAEEPPAAVPVANGAGAGATPAQRKDREAERRSERERQRRDKRQREVEAEIEASETRLSELSLVINQPDFYQTHDQPQALFSTWANLQREIEALYAELEKLAL